MANVDAFEALPEGYELINFDMLTTNEHEDYEIYLEGYDTNVARRNSTRSSRQR